MGIEQGFFRGLSEKKRLLLKKPEIISLENRGDFACAALIIDHFLTCSTKINDTPAEKLLSILDLFRNTPNYPRPQTSREYLTSSEYLQQLCLTSDDPERLNALMRSIASAVKRIAINEIIQNAYYYQTTRTRVKKPLTIESLLLPYALNPFIGDALSNALGLTFIQLETKGNKTLAKQTPLPHRNSGELTLIIHWQDNLCLISPQINHSGWFNSLFSEKNKLSLSEEPYTPLETSFNQNIKNLQHQAIQKRYIQMKQQLDELDLPMEELQHRYCNALDCILENLNKTYHGISFGSQYFFEEMLCDTQPASVDSLEVSQENRIKRELKQALSRLIALDLIPNDLKENIMDHDKSKPETSLTR